jgi:hypothetical protein
VAIGNAMFVRDRNTLTNNEQPMDHLSFKRARMEPSWNGWPAIGLIESLKIQGDDALFCIFSRRPTRDKASTAQAGSLVIVVPEIRTRVDYQIEKDTEERSG